MRVVQQPNSFYVYCAWCGSIIREEKTEDTEGTCLRCFYQLLNERHQSQPSTKMRDGVSDR